MTEQTTTTFAIALDEPQTLEEAVVEAKWAAIAAWKIQSITTAAEGFDYEAANAAIAQAEAADAYYRQLAARLEGERVALRLLQAAMTQPLRKSRQPGFVQPDNAGKMDGLGGLWPTAYDPSK